MSCAVATQVSNRARARSAENNTPRNPRRVHAAYLFRMSDMAWSSISIPHNFGWGVTANEYEFFHNRPIRPMWSHPGVLGRRANRNRPHRRTGITLRAQRQDDGARQPHLILGERSEVRVLDLVDT